VSYFGSKSPGTGSVPSSGGCGIVPFILGSLIPLKAMFSCDPGRRQKAASDNIALHSSIAFPGAVLSWISLLFPRSASPAPAAALLFLDEAHLVRDHSEFA